MNPSEFGLFITWTCYGTWLPGDARGSVSNVLLPEGGFEPKQNTPGTPYQAGDDFTFQRARALQRGETVWLTAPQAECVAECLIAACGERGWRLFRAAVMANHVHALLLDVPDDGPQVRRVLKLNRSYGSRRWWTQGGSDRYLRGMAALLCGANYIEQQERQLATVVDGVMWRVVRRG
jgi:REP element-mobilizing transposase RayT